MCWMHRRLHQTLYLHKWYSAEQLQLQCRFAEHPLQCPGSFNWFLADHEDTRKAGQRHSRQAGCPCKVPHACLLSVRGSEA